MRYLFLPILLSIFLYSTLLQAEDAKDYEELEDGMVVKTVDGLRFVVPKDRPIEKKDGVVAPMSLDKYVAMKFAKIEERFQKLETSLGKIEEDLKSIKEDIKVFKKSKKFLEYFYQD